MGILLTVIVRHPNEENRKDRNAQQQCPDAGEAEREP